MKGSYFSKKVLEMRSSAIGDLIKRYPGKGDIIALTGGRPHPSTFPVEIIKELMNEVLGKYWDSVLQYGPTPGCSVLTDEIKRFMERRYRINTSNADVLVTTGSAQALDLAGMVFINPGDIVAMEAPTYADAIDAFAQYDPKFVQVPIDDEGVRVDILEDELKELKANDRRIKFIYTIPTFHNPAGVTMSEDRRKYLLELANRYDFLIIEDDAYRELSYSKEGPPPPIKHWDSDGRVIYFGSFSKTFAPGLRVGWIIAEPEIINKFEIVKQRRDLHTSPLCQYIAAEYVRRGLLEQHVLRIREFYRSKLKSMLESLDTCMPKEFQWTKPTGGMFVWVSGPNKLDTTQMLERAVKNGVAYVPSEAFYVNRDIKNSMRLNFSYPSEDEIFEGIRRLAKTCREEINSLTR